MIGLDTNVLVRYVLRDDENQFKLANLLIQQSVMQKQLIIIHLLVIQEIEWVLRSVAKRGKAEIINLFKSLLETAEVLIESEDILEQALLSFE
ncbi:MAG: PIN domain-containing protein, partial [Methylotenera sp.]